jgi:hypothetical protein
MNVLLAAQSEIDPAMAQVTDLILTWTHIGQALVGSIGALAFVMAFQWKVKRRWRGGLGRGF